jgi:hypothetical protein
LRVTQNVLCSGKPNIQLSFNLCSGNLLFVAASQNGLLGVNQANRFAWLQATSNGKSKYFTKHGKIPCLLPDNF